MTRPNPIVMLTGSPLLAPPLFLAFSVLALSWQAVPWWACIISASLAMHTVTAFFHRRRYKRWMREWNQLAAPATTKKTKTGSKRLLLLAAIALAVFLPMMKLDGTETSTTVGLVAVLWFASVCYVLSVAVRRSLRRGSAAESTEARSSEEEKPGPVTWLLPRPSNSPSRAYIEAHLPEHVAKLIKGSQEREESAEVDR